jgi:glyceraldehyde-3-phosphate dehydrogenase/erythrose-4-phosphate dehydrogenase
MITNDEAVELLDYIAMNDLENAYDAEEMLSQQTCTTTAILRIFRILELYEDELPY